MKSVNTSLKLIRLLVVSLGERWNNYKSKSKSFKRGEKCIQEHLYKHFESEGYTEFLDVSITLTDKADGSIPTNRE